MYFKLEKPKNSRNDSNSCSNTWSWSNISVDKRNVFVVHDVNVVASRKLFLRLAQQPDKWKYWSSLYYVRWILFLYLVNFDVQTIRFENNADVAGKGNSNVRGNSMWKLYGCKLVKIHLHSTRAKVQYKNRRDMIKSK